MSVQNSEMIDSAPNPADESKTFKDDTTRHPNGYELKCVANVVKVVKLFCLS